MRGKSDFPPHEIRLVYTPLDVVNIENIEINEESYFCDISIRENLPHNAAQLKNHMLQIMKLLEDPRNPLGEVSQYHSNKITANQSSESLLYTFEHIDVNSISINFH